MHRAPSRWVFFLFCFVLLIFLCRECRRCFYRLVVSYKKAQENLVFLNQGLIDHETFTLDIKYESNLNFPREFLVLLDLICHAMMNANKNSDLRKTNNEHDWTTVKYLNVLHHNRTKKQSQHFFNILQKYYQLYILGTLMFICMLTLNTLRMLDHAHQ